MPRSPILLGSTSERERATRAGATRMAVGALLLLAPGIGRRVFGVPDDQDNTAVRLLARLFGIRNVVLGTWALLSRDHPPEQRRVCYQLNATVDLIDVVALGIAGIGGQGMIQAAIMGSVLGTTEGLAWVDLLGDLDPQEPEGSVSLV